MPTFLQFYSAALNSVITGQKALVDEFSTLPTEGFVATADVEVALATLQDVFQFKPSESGIEDVQFRLVTSTTATLPLGIDLATSKMVTGKVSSNTEQLQTIGHDWSRWLGLKLFNDYRGSNFFKDEDEVIDLQSGDNGFAKALQAKLVTQTAITDGSESVSKNIFNQIIAKANERFGSDANGGIPRQNALKNQDGTTASAGWLQIPIRAGDRISFTLEVKPNATQGSIVTPAVTIASRTYMVSILVKE